MLKIINNLQPFFEDCYRELNVREYAKQAKISPPTASKLLKGWTAEELLKQREEHNRLLFSASRETVFRDLARIYWGQRLKRVIAAIEGHSTVPVVMLFGSLAKAEAKGDSDVDIAIFAPEKNIIDMEPFAKHLKREINLHWFRSMSEIPNPHLRNNIINGYILKGLLRWE